MKIVVAILIAIHTTDSIARGWHYGNSGEGGAVFFFSLLGIGLLIALYNNPVKTIFAAAIFALAVGGSLFVVAKLMDYIGLLAIVPALMVFHGAFKLWEIVYPEDHSK